jgi:hypothetical protein
MIISLLVLSILLLVSCAILYNSNLNLRAQIARLHIQQDEYLIKELTKSYTDGSEPSYDYSRKEGRTLQ